MKLSNILKNYREENELSQREFARRCGLSHGTISLLEMGMNPQTGEKIEPDLRTYRRLAEGMGITTADLSKMLRTDNIILGSLSEEDQQRLEALHQNPKLRLLFDIQKNLDDSDLNAVLGVVNAIAKERGDDD